jgi:hypothetical protein
MSLMLLLGALALFWLVAVVVVVGLCASAARADRESARRPSTPLPAPSRLRLIA